MRAPFAAALILASLILVAPALAQVSPVMAVQGVLKNPAGLLLSGPYDATFSVYDAETGGTALATIGPQTVIATNGLFTTLLDLSGSGLAFDKDYWLEVSVGAETLAPRQRLTPAPYALALPGLVSVGGNIGIGTASPSDTLSIQVNAPIGGISINNSDSSGYARITLMNGGISNSIIDAGPGYLGIGTVSSYPVMFLAGGPERVRITPEGNVGIGTTSPATKLDVIGGMIRADQGIIVGNVTYGVPGLHIYSEEGAELRLTSMEGESRLVFANGTNFLWDIRATSPPASRMLLVRDALKDSVRLTIDDSGNVGIGTVAPAEKLHVAGNVKIDGNLTVSGSLNVEGAAGGCTLIGTCRGNAICPVSLPEKCLSGVPCLIRFTDDWTQYTAFGWYTQQRGKWAAISACPQVSCGETRGTNGDSAQTLIMRTDSETSPVIALYDDFYRYDTTSTQLAIVMYRTALASLYVCD